MRNLEARLRELECDVALPALPDTVVRVLELSARQSTSMAELAAVLKADPALASRILSVANSAYYGFPRRVGSLQLALTLLGMREIRRIAIAESLLRGWERVAAGLLDPRRFWEHSVCVGFLAERLGGGVDEAFVAGLLHDVGILALAVMAPEAGARLYGWGNREPLPQTEQGEVGFDHAELGAWLASRWSLPPLICDAILAHHGPAEVGALGQCVGEAEDAAWAEGAGAWGSAEAARTRGELGAVVEEARAFFAALTAG